MLLVPDDGRVPVHRGMCFFEIFYFIFRTGQLSALVHYTPLTSVAMKQKPSDTRPPPQGARWITKWGRMNR
ncbi:hypothetical protein EQ819_23070, partial [Escherichia coli]